MEEYKANSHRSKEESKAEKKEVKPVVKGTVKRKKNGTRKLADTFISEDVHNVKSYIVWDVLIPAAKKAISDIVTNGVEMILYGETRGSGKKHSHVDYISYDRFSDRDRRDRRDGKYSRNVYSYDDLIYESRREAEEVLNQLDDLIDVYDVASVADLYEASHTDTTPQDSKYGWTSLRNADIVRVRNGYIIRLPKAKPID